MYAAGNTEERYRVGALGVRPKGSKREGPFKHATGHGWVKHRPGKYDHAKALGARVDMLIVEVTGALTPRSAGFVVRRSRRARGPQARDGTKYGTSKMSATSFYVHHTQRLSAAAACGDVKGIFESVRAAKQHLAAGPSAEARMA